MSDDRRQPPLRTVPPDEVPAVRRTPIDAATLAEASAIVDDVRAHGAAALARHAERFGDVGPGEPIALGPGEITERARALGRDDRSALERAADRIRAFADAQRRSLHDVRIAVPGGEAGHTAVPVERAGCYAPGGRYPLPSSVLMTAVTARSAGVDHVVLASPRPGPAVCAAAELAGVDRLISAGGAHAIAAMAFGCPGLRAAGDAVDLEPCDAVVGPGNRWVTAAKQLVAGVVAIDMLAGPSELLILADDHADPTLLAADLLAQAEHDADAAPMLVCTCERVIDATLRSIEEQLADLPTAPTARAALANGFVVHARSRDEALRLADRIAAEHLELHLRDAEDAAARIRHAGALFIGSATGEIAGDYGAGPNHTLPTGGTARSTAGLSVLTFLRARAWLRLDGESGEHADRDELMADTARLARLEGLEAHARAADRRLGTRSPASG